MTDPSSQAPLHLVTGVAGNLGSSVAARLLADGADVRGLVLPGDPAAARVPAEVDLRTGDVMLAGTEVRTCVNCPEGDIVLDL